MNHTLHLFFKDARRLWPQALVFLMLLALYLSSDPSYTNQDRISGRWFLLSVLTYLACWTMAATTIHQEPLVGDRQYWLTRPFTRGHLLAAKALSAALFIMLPLFAGHVLVLYRLGFPVVQSLPALAMRDALFVAAFVLPAVALAAVTRNLAEMVLAASVGFVLLAGVGRTLQALSLLRYWGEYAWIRTSLTYAVLTLGSATVLLIQYRRRRNGLARALAAATMAAVIVSTILPPRRWVFTIQVLFSRRQIDGSAGRIVFDQSARSGREFSWGSNDPHSAVLEVPIRIENLPPGLGVGGASAQFVVRSANAGEWRSGWRIFQVLQGDVPNLWIALPLDASFYRRVKEERVAIAGFVDLTLDARQPTRIIPATDGLDYVPGAGVCGFRVVDGTQSIFRCLTPWPRAQVYFSHGPEMKVLGMTSDGCAPWPTSASFSALERHSVYTLGPTYLSVQPWVAHPVAHIRRQFEFRNLRPSDYYVADY